MVLIHTRDFGQRRVREEEIIFFVDPIIGFEENRRFILIEHPRTWPFHWLQSATEPALAFPVVDADFFGVDYTPTLCDGEASVLLAGLAVESPAELRMMALAVIPPDPHDMRVNLRAPIALNPRRGLAKQLVLADTRYPMQFHFAEDVLAPLEENLCSGAGASAAQPART